MDERHLLSAVRYVELNPVRAGLVKKPEKYKWSSAAGHMSGRNDGFVKVFPLLETVRDWREFLSGAGEEEFEEFRRHERN